MNLARLGNKYLAETEPWRLIKKEAKKTETILNISLQIVYKLAILSQPFLPNTSKKLSELLNSKLSNWSSAKKEINLKAGHKISMPEHLFEIISDEQINAEIEKLK